MPKYKYRANGEQVEHALESTRNCDCLMQQEQIAKSAAVDFFCLSHPKPPKTYELSLFTENGEHIGDFVITEEEYGFSAAKKEQPCDTK